MSVKRHSVLLVAQVTQLGEGTAAVVDCDSTYVSREAGLNELVRAGVTAIICAYSPDMITMIGLLHDRGIDIGSENVSDFIR